MMAFQTAPVPELSRRILQIIFEQGQATRQQLVDALGCTLITVSKAVTAMLDEGLLIVDGTLSSAVGRRTSLLKLNPRHRLCVSVDIGYSGVKLALVRMNGEIEKKLVLPPLPDPVTQGVPHDEMLRAIEALVLEAGRERLLGLCVGISGMVNFEEGRVLFCPNIHGYDDRPLAEELSQRFALPVLLDTSARCMAMGEYYFGAARGVKELLFLSLGTGSIASGILTGGRPYRGAMGFAGEVGHTCVRPGQRRQRCSCGSYDCLELYASLEMLRVGIAGALERFDGYSPARKLLAGQPLTLDHLREVIATRDPLAMEPFDAAVSDIASVLVGTVNLLTPPLVVLGGGLVKFFPEVIEEIDRQVRSNCLMPIRNHLRITGSRLEDDGALRGSAAMLIAYFLGDGQ